MILERPHRSSKLLVTALLVCLYPAHQLAVAPAMHEPDRTIVPSNDVDRPAFDITSEPHHVERQVPEEARTFVVDLALPPGYVLTFGSVSADAAARWSGGGTRPDVALAINPDERHRAGYDPIDPALEDSCGGSHERRVEVIRTELADGYQVLCAEGAFFWVARYVRWEHNVLRCTVGRIAWSSGFPVVHAWRICATMTVGHHVPRLPPAQLVRTRLETTDGRRFGVALRLPPGFVEEAGVRGRRFAGSSPLEPVVNVWIRPTSEHGPIPDPIDYCACRHAVGGCTRAIRSIYEQRLADGLTTVCSLGALHRVVRFAISDDQTATCTVDFDRRSADPDRQRDALAICNSLTITPQKDAQP